MDVDGIHVNIKAYFLDENSSLLEVHRLRIAVSDDSSTILKLKLKLLEVFPQIESKQFIIYWKDEDYDDVILSNDEEFNIALNSHLAARKTMQKIFVKLKNSVTEDSKPNSFKTLHNGVECDECNGLIKGYRYKCLECKNYDLCEQCERKHFHSLHHMIRIPESNATRNSLFFLKKYHCPFAHSDKSKESKIKKHESCHSYSEEHNGSRKRKHFKCKHHGDNKCGHQGNKKLDVKNDTFCDVFKYFSEIVQKCSNGIIERENEPSGTSSDIKKAFNAEYLKNMGRYASTFIDSLDLLKSSSVNKKNDKTGKDQNGEPSSAEIKDEAQESEQGNINFEEKVEEISETLAKQSFSGNNEKNDWFFVCNSTGIPDVSTSPTALDNSDSQKNSEEQNFKTPSYNKDSKTSDFKLHPDPLIAQAMEYMITMGFHNVESLIPILELKRGDICEVLDFLLTSGKGSSSTSN